jgi:hypothetical protein
MQRPEMKPTMNLKFCSVRIAYLSLAAALIAAAPVHAADWYGGPRPLFVEHCLTRNTGEIDRYRLCERFFQNSFTQERFPDAAIFLRQRLIDLIPSYERAAWTAFQKFEYASYVILAAALGAALTATVAGIATRAMLGAVAAVLISALATFGFNTQFKSNFAAYRQLTTLRDGIEVALVDAARTNQSIEAGVLANWVREYAKIVDGHAESFGAAFTNPVVPMGIAN